MKLQALFIALLMVVPVVGVFNEKYGAKNETESIDNIHFQDDGKYIKAIATDALTLRLAGYPMLPYYTKTYELPVGTKIDSIDVIVKGVSKIKLEKKISPAPKAMTHNIKISEMETKEGKIYSQDIFYPEKWYDYRIGVGIKDGKRVLFLTIYLYPLRYNAYRNEAMKATDFEIKIDYQMPEKAMLNKDKYDLLIIAPSEWKDELEPLKEHKEARGIKTIIVGLDEIYGGKYFATQGRDDAEKIKYFIKNAIEEWGIEYVMLVGGRQGGVFKERWLMPVRYTHLDDQSNWETGYLSDLYFADVYKYEDGNIVFEDWDSNGNGKFAEWTMRAKDTLDLYPDVYIGRLACRNVWEVKMVVNKIIEYENSNPASQEWFKRMVLVGGDSWPDANDPYYEGEEEGKAALSYMDGFEGIKIWTSLGTLTGPEDVINAVNEGCGFLFFDGHGNPMNWATHPPHDEETWIDGLGVGDMSKLANKGMYPVCVVGGCHNCQFNVSVFNLLRIYEGFNEWYQYIWKGETSPECWGWWLARLKDAGSIATLGYTGLDYFAIGDYDNDSIPDCVQYYSGFCNVNFFKNYANGVKILGVVHANTLIDYINTHDVMKDNIHCKTVEEWVLLGDPTLVIG
ncbi:MAG: peptidase C25 [Thermoplasmata archaeon]|nr:peptidase C25 [Thermoplasmata archaeon]